MIFGENPHPYFGAEIRSWRVLASVVESVGDISGGVMSAYEYKVVPAPQKGVKAKGVKAGEARFALALETLMNELAREGWEYQRAETLPSVERSGFTGTATEWRNMLVFRRPVSASNSSALREEPKVTTPIPGPSQTPPLTAEPARLELIKTPENSTE